MLLLEKRSWLAYIFILRGTPLLRIRWRLVLVVTVATSVTVAHVNYGHFQVGLTVAPFTLVGLALGIFLGFRNNTSYDRFWEGRKLWGALVNTSRSFARQILTLVGPTEPASTVDAAALLAIHRELVYRVIGFVHSFRHHLRNESQPGDAAPFLDAGETERCVSSTNAPQAVLSSLGDQLRALWLRGLIHPMHLPVLEASLTSLTDIQGACERIRNTPIPASYTVLIHRLVAIYVFALPFGLVATIGFWTPVVAAIVAYAFLGLDAIGDEIEEPFGYETNDLPLSTLSTMIEANLRERLPGEPPVRLLQPREGVLQ